MAVGDSYKKRMLGAHRGDLEPKDKDIEHVETLDGSEEKPGRVRAANRKVKRHLRRFWCCYLIGGIVFLAIFLPIFFIYIIPAIAQRIVDDTDLPVYGANIVDPTPDTITFSLDTALTVPKGLKVRTDPLALHLFNRDVKPMKPYLQVNLASYTLDGHTDMHVTQADTKIEDEDEFVKTLSNAVYSRNFTMSAQGKTLAHLGALKAGLTLDKDVELAGLDKLRGFSIPSARLLIPAEDDGTNLRGQAILPNHSIVTFALGNVTLNLKSKDLVIGQALIQNVVLHPGNNTLDLSGHLDIKTVLDNLGTILENNKDALPQGNIELSASGNQTVYHGKHIPYFERVLNNLTITTSMPIMKLLLDTVQGLLGNENNNGSFLDDLAGMGDTLANITNVLDGLDLS
ncbi:hypothetical protein FE257_003339 [Aspergillus nanangensis]|uniref:Uncharacterized protein n=1 Tax=Aspergillus nanangensis TaxID=2582783 RepID=A0AAD4GVL9_ASPNN|nr:hypothetical protein FE257_003339 [Aspergillus nanangensis]